MASIIVRISGMASIVVRIGGMSGIIIRVIATLRRAIVCTGVESAGTANMGWIVPKAVTIFPFVVFGFDLTSTSALRIFVDCRMTYTLAMIDVVSYRPRVLWSTTILTIERVDSRRTFFFIRIVAMPSVTV